MNEVPDIPAPPLETISFRAAVVASLEVGKFFRQLPKDVRARLTPMLRNRSSEFLASDNEDARVAGALIQAVLANSETFSGDPDQLAANIAIELARARARSPK